MGWTLYPSSAVPDLQFSRCGHDIDSRHSRRCKTLAPALASNFAAYVYIVHRWFECSNNLESLRDIHEIEGIERGWHIHCLDPDKGI